MLENLHWWPLCLLLDPNHDYPFTLAPSLGVVDMGVRGQFVMVIFPVLFEERQKELAWGISFEACS